MIQTSHRVIALVIGFICHLSFVCAISIMAYSLYFGLTHEFFMPHLTGTSAWIADLLLLLQFPLSHSFLLTPRGRKLMTCFLPKVIQNDLATTIYALIASLQLGSVFLFWSPLARWSWFPATPLLKTVCISLYCSSWLFLTKAIIDAGPGLQTGYIGWRAVVHKKPVKYPDMPTRGLFRLIRQPIYLGFFLVLLTAPGWSLDHLLFLILWGSYCFLGPLLKERRFMQLFGERFLRYSREVSYMLPSFNFDRFKEN